MARRISVEIGPFHKRFTAENASRTRFDGDLQILIANEALDKSYDSVLQAEKRMKASKIAPKTSVAVLQLSRYGDLCRCELGATDVEIDGVIARVVQLAREATADYNIEPGRRRSVPDLC